MKAQRQHREVRVVVHRGVNDSFLAQHVTRRSWLRKGFKDPCINAFVVQAREKKGKQS